VCDVSHTLPATSPQARRGALLVFLILDSRRAALPRGLRAGLLYGG